MFRSSRLELRADRGQRHRDIFKRRAALALRPWVRLSPKRPDVPDAEALQIGDGAQVVGGDMVDAVAVVRQGELAAELEPFLSFLVSRHSASEDSRVCTSATYLCDAAARIRLCKALAQRSAVTLEPRALLGRDL